MICLPGHAFPVCGGFPNVTVHRYPVNHNFLTLIYGEFCKSGFFFEEKLV